MQGLLRGTCGYRDGHWALPHDYQVKIQFKYLLVALQKPGA
jgi:hypothetical protein